MSGEKEYVKNIINAIRAIRLGTKKPSETNIAISFKLLKEVNLVEYEEWMEKYKSVLKERSK